MDSALGGITEMYMSSSAAFSKSGKFLLSGLADVDSVLSGLGICEIGAHAGFISLTEKRPFWNDVRTFLGSKTTLAHCHRSKLLLPQLLLLRLNGLRIPDEYDSVEAQALFFEFLALGKTFDKITNRLTFLQLLLAQDDVLRCFSDPEDFLSRALLPAEDRDTLSTTVQQFCGFLRFCHSFADLLRRSEKFKAMRAEFWIHFRYWFPATELQPDGTIMSCLSQFLKWRLALPGPTERKELEISVAELKQLITYLADPMNLWPIPRFLGYTPPSDFETLSPLEVTGLIEALESRGPVANARTTAEIPQEPTFDVIVNFVPEGKKSAVVAAIVELGGLGAISVDDTPKTVLHSTTRGEAERAKRKIEAAGGRAELKQSP
jgi:large subunit ribosomal protein L7/L12